MRPLPGDPSPPRRSSSLNDNEATPLPRPTMTYFLTDEESIGESHLPSPVVPPKQHNSVQSSSTYGVESLDNVINALDGEDGNVRKARRNWKQKLGVAAGSPEEDISEPTSPTSNDLSRNASPSHQRRPSQTAVSRPFTPLSFGSPAPASIIGSPYSRRTSDAGSYTDDVASQAIVSSGDEDREMASDLVDSGSAPQLVMPTMKMPSRRPFTERGKNMGRLKVLIAGDSGVGKTALIKAIVQTCEDIVHVDPLNATPISIPQSRKNSKSKSRFGSTDMQSTLQITEIYASTRAYPAWWSDLEESRILRRRKSMGDSVLERNLCFVDTPGYGNKTSCLESIEPVVDYVESQLQRAASMQDIVDSDIVSMLSGNGGTQVDLVFYVFTQRVKPVDIEYLRRLTQITNIVPLISRSDTLTAEELSFLKENISSEFHANDIPTAPLGLSQSDCHGPRPVAPFAISSQPSKDEETMDASLLMSPDYIQPLLPSELHYLVSQIFERDTISFLRHSAAKKFINWRSSSNPSKPLSLYRPISSSTSLIPLTSSMLPGPAGVTNSYTLARVTDHAQREEKLAQIRLSNWAADLTRSFQNEQRQFEALKVSERAVWLTEKLSECVHEGTLVPVNQDGTIIPRPSQGKSRRRMREVREAGMGVNPVDPLGLLQLNDDMKRRALFALRVVGSFGIIGGLAFWIARAREWHVAEDNFQVGNWFTW